MILHRLDGCAPTPLASYLKALGVLRLVAEQLDPAVRGWWQGERFLLVSQKHEDELLDFFLTSYAPTPFVAPWNKGSGFYYDNDPGLEPVRTSTAPRLARLREGYFAAKALMRDIEAADKRLRLIKDEVKVKSLSAAQRKQIRESADYKSRYAEADRTFKRFKAELLPSLRLAWRGAHLEWMDAAMVLDHNGEPLYPALLGSGGNDGRLDFTNNFFKRLGDLFDLSDETAKPREGSRVALRAALFADVTRTAVEGVVVGQFFPGAAGGANAGNGPDAGSRLNPWDYVLMLEGVIPFAAAATRRLESQTPSRAAAPFAIGGQAAGYASAASIDESARGEQWMPLWSQPVSYPELRRLFAEGRAQIGTRRAREPLDIARAVVRFGTARGIGAFQRYGYIERNGQSNLAVPLGRFVVPEHAVTRCACLDDLDAWLFRLRLERDAPARFGLVQRRLADAVFAALQHPGEAARWQSVLLRIAEVEDIQVHGAGRSAGPAPRLRPEWVQAADDGSAELRLALALALQVDDSNRDTNRDGVRRHWLTLEKGRYKDARSGRVINGRSGIDDAIALVSRRLIEASARGERRLPLEPGCGVAASRHDLARLLAGQVDLDRCLALARALMALDMRACMRGLPRLKPSPACDWPDDAWLAIRLALLPRPLADGRRPACDPAILRRLNAGDATGAFAIARRRLHAASIPCSVRVVAATAEKSRLYAAALAFPIKDRTAVRFALRLAPVSTEETV
jgi:CRISPR-associated protein Csx17